MLGGVFMETVLIDKNHIFTDDKSLKMPEGFISSDEYEEKLDEEEQTTIQEKEREFREKASEKEIGVLFKTNIDEVLKNNHL